MQTGSVPKPSTGTRWAIMLMISTGGLAALSWELIWELQISLAVGRSAIGAAITLAVTMGGMACGAMLAGRVFRTIELDQPMRAYGVLELMVGVGGLCLLPGLRFLEQLDTVVWHSHPSLAYWVHGLGLVLLIGLPAMAMGATIPVLGLVSRSLGKGVSRLYAANTAGAAAGVLAIAFVLLPQLGISGAVAVVAILDLLIAAVALCLPPVGGRSGAGRFGPAMTVSDTKVEAMLIFAATTGFATFALEVAWFRTLRAALQSTTDSFAIMLAAVLIPLAVGARLAGPLARRKVQPAHMLVLAGALILLMTPLMERFDQLARWPSNHYLWLSLRWFGLTLVVVGSPVFALGTVLPGLLDACRTPRQWGRVYGVNTLAAIAGALSAAWVLLPVLGFARTCWFVGLLVSFVGGLYLRGRGRLAAGAMVIAALGVAISTESGIGRTRLVSYSGFQQAAILGFAETPDAAVSVVESAGGVRQLVIDGFIATSDARGAHYMTWMGHLPMILHPNPERALVIAFGTGQTADAVRAEGPLSLDIAEISPKVLEMAPLFPANHGVLQDARVRTIVMDGRAWLRRTREKYDVVTLEPMPPNFAGVNALYSRECYELMSKRLNPGGVVAQWVPFHILPPEYATSVVATFCEVFKDAVLWVDPVSGTGIVLGRVEVSDVPLGSYWPGLRHDVRRSLGNAEIVSSLRLDGAGIARYAAYGAVITDDNRLLEYGDVRPLQLRYGPAMAQANVALVERVRAR